MWRLSFRMFRFALFLRFSFRENEEESGERLCQHIRLLGVCAIKGAQWFYNFINFKYEDHKRPVYLRYLHTFQTFALSVPLTDKDIRGIQQRIPLIHSVHHQPMAAGSLGQVHRCTSSDGTVYILKKRHSGVEKELQEYAFFFRVIEWFNRFFQTPYRFSEFVEFLQQQIDFSIEAQNMDTMRQYYQQDYPRLRIPQVYYASPDLLLMEYIPSTHNPGPEDDRYINLMRLWLFDQMLLRDISHGDIHYGNWGFNREQDYIVMYDLGRVTPSNIIRPLVKQCENYDKEGIYREICIATGYTISRAKFETWWDDFVANQYCFSLEMIQKIVGIMVTDCAFNVRLLYILNTFNIFALTDQHLYLQRIHHTEIKKLSYSLLKSAKVLPEYQKYLWNNYFLRKKQE